MNANFAELMFLGWCESFCGDVLAANLAVAAIAARGESGGFSAGYRQAIIESKQGHCFDCHGGE